MLGTADELALEPEKKTVFMEDLSEAELNTKVGLPFLQNPDLNRT
jgi:hypothetical protein